MIVEDEPNLRALYMQVLRGAGHEVHCCASAGEGLHLFKNDNYDLVIADRNMPHRDGKSLVYDIKAINPGQRVVVITGWATDNDFPPEFDVETFSKPVSRLELCQIVNVYGRGADRA